MFTTIVIAKNSSKMREKAALMANTTKLYP